LASQAPILPLTVITVLRQRNGITRFVSTQGQNQQAGTFPRDIN
jgi:hypothetical protein